MLGWVIKVELHYFLWNRNLIGWKLTEDNNTGVGKGYVAIKNETLVMPLYYMSINSWNSDFWYDYTSYDQCNSLL